jgi:peptidoglycan/xylan/chitin deacetylase (PgdA/CDA1 family)
MAHPRRTATAVALSAGAGLAITVVLGPTASGAPTAPQQSATSATSKPGASKPAAKTVTTPPPAAVSFSFDDGLIGQYTNARPILKAAGLKATFYIISDGLGWGTQTNMGPAQVRQLVADGDEIGNHTRDHPDLTGLAADQVTAEFADAQAAIKAQVGVTPTTCAYPSGATNSEVETAAATFFTACRGTADGVDRKGALARYDLTVLYVHTETTPAQVQAALTSLKASGGWLILVFHGVGTVLSDDDVTTEQFQGIVTAAKSSGVPVKTVVQGLAAFVR